jgi:hypothetical protein
VLVVVWPLITTPVPAPDSLWYWIELLTMTMPGSTLLMTDWIPVAPAEEDDDGAGDGTVAGADEGA